MCKCAQAVVGQQFEEYQYLILEVRWEAGQGQMAHTPERAFSNMLGLGPHPNGVPIPNPDPNPIPNGRASSRKCVHKAERDHREEVCLHDLVAHCHFTRHCSC